MRNAGLGSWPERRLRISPQRPAIWFEGTTTTHGEFAHRVRRAAAALAGLGVRPRRPGRLVRGQPPHRRWRRSTPAGSSARSGCRSTPASPPPRREYVLEHSGASLVVHGREHGTTADALRAELPAVRHWVAAETPLAGGADSLDWRAAARRRRAGAPRRAGHPRRPLPDHVHVGHDRPAQGRGAHPRQHDLVRASTRCSAWTSPPDERTLGLAPLFHIGGLNGTVNPTLLRGGCVVLVRGFDPPATLAVIAEQRVTSFFAVPTMLDALSRAARTSTPSTCRRCARSAPPARRSPSRCCAPGSTAGSPCSRPTG